MTKLIVLYIQIAMQWNETKRNEMEYFLASGGARVRLRVRKTERAMRAWVGGMGSSRKKQQISIVSF